MNKILVVEDEKSMRDSLGLMLRKEGSYVATADFALQAKQLPVSGGRSGTVAIGKGGALDHSHSPGAAW